MLTAVAHHYPHARMALATSPKGDEIEIPHPTRKHMVCHVLAKSYTFISFAPFLSFSPTLVKKRDEASRHIPNTCTYIEFGVTANK